MSSPVLVRPVRSVNGITADAVVEERHSDEMTITTHPVEVGSSVTDHAYRLPSSLVLIYVWAMGSKQNTTKDISFLKTLYQQFLTLMISATLLQVITGKRVYKNMMIEAVDVVTDYNSENILEMRLSLRELLLANTQTVQVTPAAQQLLPQRTGPTIDQGSKTLQPGVNFNSQQVPK